MRDRGRRRFSWKMGVLLRLQGGQSPRRFQTATRTPKTLTAAVVAWGKIPNTSQVDHLYVTAREYCYCPNRDVHSQEYCYCPNRDVHSQGVLLLS